MPEVFPGRRSHLSSTSAGKSHLITHTGGGDRPAESFSVADRVEPTELFTGRSQTVGRKKLGKNFLADGAVDGGRKLDNPAAVRSFSGMCDQCMSG